MNTFDWLNDSAPQAVISIVTVDYPTQERDISMNLLKLINAHIGILATANLYVTAIYGKQDIMDKIDAAMLELEPNSRPPLFNFQGLWVIHDENVPQDTVILGVLSHAREQTQYAIPLLDSLPTMPMLGKIQ
jgi:hypothetical protein